MADRIMIGLLILHGIVGISYGIEVTYAPLFDDNIQCAFNDISNAIYLNGSNPTLFSPGQTARIGCENGYRFAFVEKESLNVVCNNNGTWEDLHDINNPVGCEEDGSCPVPLIANGKVPLSRMGGYRSGEVAQVLCEPGYRLEPISYSRILCERFGTWSTGMISMPACVAPNCKVNSDVLSSRKGYALAWYPGLRSNLTERPDGFPSGTTLEFFCSRDCRLDGSSVVECQGGEWSSSFPTCELDPTAELASCPPPQETPHSSCMLVNGAIRPNGRYTWYSTVYCPCDRGYQLVAAKNAEASAYRECFNGVWSNQNVHCALTSYGCTKPPSIENGSFRYLSSPDYSLHGGYIPNNTAIHYDCDTGFTMPNDNFVAKSVCMDGLWSSTLPYCEKRVSCGSPQDIAHGLWTYVSGFESSMFEIGTVIEYQCKAGYKALSNVKVTRLECTPSGYWDDFPPKCLSVDTYCDEPKPLKNGFYFCDPVNCNMFKAGTTIEYACYKGYSLNIQHSLPIQCGTDGKWLYGNHPLICEYDDYVPPVESRENDNMRTVTIVLCTSLSVLLLLTVVIIIVGLHKRKRPVRHFRGRSMHSFCSTEPPPPQYSELPPSVVGDDSTSTDRTVLISLPDGTQARLPSYDEATLNGTGSCRNASSLNRHNSDVSGANRGREDSAFNNSMHPLTMRDQRDQISVQSYPRGDALSVAFGSIDTMNVSDNTSTTVTVRTYDSSASNPSLTQSQRATNGSVTTSNDETPLLEDHDPANHRSVTASPIIPEERGE